MTVSVFYRIKGRLRGFFLPNGMVTSEGNHLLLPFRGRMLLKLGLWALGRAEKTGRVP